MFIAERDGRIAAYVEADTGGENYVSDAPGCMNVCGAYCLPAYRGTGAAQAALACAVETFRREGCPLLGVDCETINPAASGFWCKHFTPYTRSVVRRVDENAVALRGAP